MKIKNSKDLIMNRKREEALQIIEAGLEAIDTGQVMRGIKLESDNLVVKGEKLA